MPRCPDAKCGASLIYEPELVNTPARWRCLACGWMVSDPKFRKEQPRYFPTEAVDRWIGWKKEHPGYDLYCPRSAAAQLDISESFFRESVKKDPEAPVIMGRGVIACHTPALQRWWDS
jgi:hypothetical protein